MSDKKLGLAHRLYTGELSYDFIKARKFWFTISAILLLVSIGALLLRGLNLGIEFKGGNDFQVPMSVTSTTVDDVRAQVAEIDVPDLGASVFSIGDSALRIQTRSLSPDETSAVRQGIADIAGADENSVTYSSIGASWGQQISQKAVVALIVFVILVMLLIAVWFRDAKMAIAAVLALAHDLIVTVGIYALVGFSVTPATVIGLLTILGYSLYDTVVVFDKIKENVSKLSETRMTYSQAANLAVNQVLVRSINTTIIGVLPVAALLIAGVALHSDPLADLGLALFVGMIAGAYSSIFIATPILSMLKERESAMVAHRAALAHREERAAHKRARKAAAGRLDADGDALADEAAAGTSADDDLVGSTLSDAARQQRRHTTRAARKKA